MDVNELRSIVTVVSFVLFLALVVLTWRKRNRRDHDAAAMLPFADDVNEPTNHGGHRE